MTQVKQLQLPNMPNKRTRLRPPAVLEGYPFNPPFRKPVRRRSRPIRSGRRKNPKSRAIRRPSKAPPTQRTPRTFKALPTPPTPRPFKAPPTPPTPPTPVTPRLLQQRPRKVPDTPKFTRATSRLPQTFFVECPHCQGMVEIVAVNCSIFRHGADVNGQQLNPHAPQQICEIQTVYGCGKPFYFHPTEGVRKCGYI